MSGIFLIGRIQSSFRRKKRQKLLQMARAWPTAMGEVNHWQVLDAEEDAMTTATPWQIEAGYHFTINGEYYGGYFRSVALVHREAETLAKGTPNVTVRYDPANPDLSVVLPADNLNNLPFRIFSHPQAS